MERSCRPLFKCENNDHMVRIVAPFCQFCTSRKECQLKDSFASPGKLRVWITAFRPAFHTVGVFPYTLGATISYHHLESFDWWLWATGSLAVILIMSATHLSGECFDYREDRISWSRGPSKFAGGSGVIPLKLISRKQALAAGVFSIGMAIVLGLIIWLGLGTGPWTIPIGAIGIIGGFFYSSPPFRWVSSGIGEFWIFFCYGFLTVAAGVYLPLGEIPLISFFVSVPIAGTIFNVIFANEYPDYESDRAARKRNLLTRIGRPRGVWIYTIFSIGSNMFFGLSIIAGVPWVALIFYVFPFLISVQCVRGFIRGDWKDPAKLEILCGLGILVNLGTTLSYIMAFALT